MLNMAKTKKQKEAILADYKARIKDSKGLIVLKPSKITVNESNSLKKDLFDISSEYHVVKNTLFKLALKENDLNDLVEKIVEGEYSTIFIKDDIANSSKVLKKYTEDLKLDKETSKIEIIFGVLDGAALTKEQVAELADMPDKEGSISMILGILDMALGGVINVLEDSPRSIVTIIDQAFKK